MTPGRTSRSSRSGTAVSRPIDAVGRAVELDLLLGERVRRVIGRDASIVPSASASSSASTSRLPRSGGVIFVLVS